MRSERAWGSSRSGAVAEAAGEDEGWEEGQPLSFARAVCECLNQSQPLVASLLLVAMPGAPSSFLFLVVRPGAPSSVLAHMHRHACSFFVKRQHLKKMSTSSPRFPRIGARRNATGSAGLVPDSRFS